MRTLSREQYEAAVREMKAAAIGKVKEERGGRGALGASSPAHVRAELSRIVERSKAGPVIQAAADLALRIDGYLTVFPYDWQGRDYVSVRVALTRYIPAAEEAQEVAPCAG